MTSESVQFLSCLLFLVTLCQGVPREARRWRKNFEEYDDVIELYDAVHAKRSSSPGLIRNARCKCLCRRRWESAYHCCQCMDGGCFPGSGHVTLEDGKLLAIGDLEPGQKILTADKDGRIHSDIVLGYLDRRDDVIVGYRRIVTSSGERLTLSGTHVIFVSASNETRDAMPRYAQDVSVGDYVLTATRHQLLSTEVINVTEVHVRGAFVPLTESGTLLVDNVLTSCYASFPHGISHAMMAPFRWFPEFARLTPENGIHPYVNLMKKMGRFLLPNSVLSPKPMTP